MMGEILSQHLFRINGLTKKDIAIDRKILSDLAISDSSTFEKIVKTAVN